MYQYLLTKAILHNFPNNDFKDYRPRYFVPKIGKSGKLAQTISLSCRIICLKLNPVYS